MYQCLPRCSDHGTYDLESGSCVCEGHWTGVDCSQPSCGLDCGPHGTCEQGLCKLVRVLHCIHYRMRLLSSFANLNLIIRTRTYSVGKVMRVVLPLNLVSQSAILETDISSIENKCIQIIQNLIKIIFSSFNKKK